MSTSNSRKSGPHRYAVTVNDRVAGYYDTEKAARTAVDYHIWRADARGEDYVVQIWDDHRSGERPILTIRSSDNDEA